MWTFSFGLAHSRTLPSSASFSLSFLLLLCAASFLLLPFWSFPLQIFSGRSFFFLLCFGLLASYLLLLFYRHIVFDSSVLLFSSFSICIDSSVLLHSPAFSVVLYSFCFCLLGRLSCSLLFLRVSGLFVTYGAVFICRVLRKLLRQFPWALFHAVDLRSLRTPLPEQLRRQ